MDMTTPSLARGQGRLWTPHYEPPASSLDPDLMEVDQFAARDMAMARLIAEVLHDEYPNYPWVVESNIAQGIACIRMPAIMGQTGAYVLHIDHLSTVSGTRKYVREAGGHILERWNIPRSTFDLAALLAAAARSPVKRFNHPFPV